MVYYLDLAVLIDLGAGVYLDTNRIDFDYADTMESTNTAGTEDQAASTMPSSSWQFYSGGLICCPERVIGNFKDLYSPLFADCRAFVQMANVLLAEILGGTRIGTSERWRF